jgi:hypothetical protein
MRKIFLPIFVVVLSAAVLKAQHISVASPTGGTTIYTDLNLAIQGAEAGSSVYLSGGGFHLHDSSKITKRLVIIGLGHRPDNANADGNTIISGNIYFAGGSNYSALMGVHLSGNVYIGTNAAVNTVLVRYCNVNSIQVQNSNCQSVVINQNYIRSGSSGGGSTISFTNNILHSVGSINGGRVDHNVSFGNISVSNGQISNNIFRSGSFSGSNCLFSNNMLGGTGDTNHRTIRVANIDNVFAGPVSVISSVCNFHLKGSEGKNAATDGTDVGIYGGGGFSDDALPPIPHIFYEKVPEKNDQDNILRIDVEFKTN